MNYPKQNTRHCAGDVDDDVVVDDDDDRGHGRICALAMDKFSGCVPNFGTRRQNTDASTKSLEF
jgi:hypothetical protein